MKLHETPTTLLVRNYLTTWLLWTTCIRYRSAQSSPNCTSLQGGLLCCTSEGVHTVLQGSIGLVMVLGIANRVLYKMALTPLGDRYIFFLAQFQTFSYVLLYFLVLAVKVRCATSLSCCIHL